MLSTSPATKLLPIDKTRNYVTTQRHIDTHNKTKCPLIIATNAILTEGADDIPKAAATRKVATAL